MTLFRQIISGHAHRINYILCFNHFYTVIIILITFSLAESILIALLFYSSILMHLSETKHNLTSINLLKNYSKLCLNIYRVIDSICLIYFSCLVYNLDEIISLEFYLYLIVGFVLQLIADKYIKNNQDGLYVLCQGLSYFIKYSAIYTLLVYRNIYYLQHDILYVL